MKLTEKLLGLLHRVFDRDPDRFLAFRLRYDGAMSWAVEDGVLSTSVSGGSGTSLSVALAGHTIKTLVDYLAAQQGYSVVSMTSDHGLSALCLLDAAAGQDDSNGDHIYGFGSVLHAYLDSVAAELTVAREQVVAAVDQMSVKSADDVWLDEWGGYFGVPRNQAATIVIPARTNMLKYSEQFDNSAWGKLAAGTGVAPVVTANFAANPIDGAMTADRVVFNLGGGTTSADHSTISQGGTSVVGANYTFSVWAKSNDGNSYTLSFEVGSGVSHLLTVTPTWQRLSVTDMALGTNYYPIIRLRGYVPITSNTADISLFGAQFESASAASDYISTLGSPVTVPPIYGPESDADYGNRIIIEVTRPRGNNVAIEKALFDAFGQACKVTNAVKWGGPTNTYNGVRTFNGAINYDSPATPIYGLFSIVIGYDLLNGGDQSAFGAQVRAFVEKLRDAGTQLDSLSLSGSMIYDSATLAPGDSGSITVTTQRYYNGAAKYDGAATYAGTEVVSGAL